MVLEKTANALTPKQRNSILIMLVIAAVGLSFLTAYIEWFVGLGAALVLLVVAFIVRAPVIGILIIAFALPLERIGAYEFGTTTIRITQGVLIITIVAWLVRKIFQRDYSYAHNPLLPLLAVFIAINFIGLPHSLNFQRSVTVLAYIIFTVLLAWLVPNIVTKKEHVQKIVLVLLVSFILVAGFGLFQFFGDMTGLPTEVTGLRDLYTKDVLGFTRVQSTAYEPLYFANYLLLPISVLFALFLSRKNIVKSGWLVTLFALGMVNLILTVSRGGYVALFVTLAVIGLFYLRRLLIFRNMLAFIIGIVVVLWVASAALGTGEGFLTKEKFQEHVSNIFYGASYSERIYTFEQAVVAWREYPLTGIGPGGFGPFMAPHPSYIPEDGWRIVNNEYIEILAENGIIGLLIFLLMLGLLVIRSVKAIAHTQDGYLRAIMVALLGGFLGILAQYMTFSTLYIIHVWFVIGLMIAVQNIIFKRLQSLDNPS